MAKYVSGAFSALSVLLVSGAADAHFDWNRDARFYTVESRPVGEVPESVTVDDDDNVYYSDLATIRVKPRRGADHVFSTLPVPVFALGVKVGPDGCIYNTSVSLDPAVPGAFVWRSCEDGGTAEIFATLDQTGGPNDLAFDDDENAYVTDPFLGRIYKVDPGGDATVWLQSPLLNGNTANPYLVFHSQGANGVALDRKKKELYVGVLDYGRVVRIPIGKRGAAGAPKVFVESSELQGIDGIAFDKTETLYAAINGQNKIVTISKKGRIETFSTDSKFDGVSSVAFGQKGIISERTLYAASSAFSTTFGFVTGTPKPAILATFVPIPGLGLP